MEVREFLQTLLTPTSKEEYKTIPVGLNALILKYDIKWGEMAAGTIMALIPTMILFSFAQKYMIEGLTAGAVKG